MIANNRKMDASDRTRRIRSLVEFQAKADGMDKTPFSQSSEFATGVDYGAIVSNENGCCETNYAAYFTVEENTRASSSAFNIPAESEFTIEWWQTDVPANEMQSRNIFSFGTFIFNQQERVLPEFACVLVESSVILRIAGENYPLTLPDTPEGPGATPSINYGEWSTMVNISNHFAIMRVKDADDQYKIRVFKNGEFLGTEFIFPDAISITNTGNTTMTIRNQINACSQAQMYGSLPSFRWTAALVYNPSTDSTFTPSKMPFERQADNVLTINTFPTSGSVKTAEGFTITRYTPDNLPLCQ